MYAKMTCWCTTGDKEKTKAITDGEAKIASLKTTIQEVDDDMYAKMTCWCTTGDK